MAAAAAGINKQVAVAVMEPCIRHGRGANAHTVKVNALPISIGPQILSVILISFDWVQRAVVSLHLGVDCCCVGVGATGCQPQRLDCGLAASESCARQSLLRTYIAMNVDSSVQINGCLLLQC